MKISKEFRNLAIAGSVVGLAAIILTALGNPKNMGFCIACFVRVFNYSTIWIKLYGIGREFFIY